MEKNQFLSFVRTLMNFYPQRGFDRFLIPITVEPHTND